MFTNTCGRYKWDKKKKRKTKKLKKMNIITRYSFVTLYRTKGTFHVTLLRMLSQNL